MYITAPCITEWWVTQKHVVYSILDIYIVITPIVTIPLTPFMARCTRYNIVIKFVSDLRLIVAIFRLFRFPPLIKTDHNDMTEILLKVALNTMTQTPCTGN